MKILWRVALVVVLLLALCYGLFLVPAVQTFAVGRVTSFLKENTGADITVGRVDFRPVRSLVLHDLLLRDFKSDTLLSVERVTVKISGFHLRGRSLAVSEIDLDNAMLVLWHEGVNNKVGIDSSGINSNIGIFVRDLKRLANGDNAKADTTASAKQKGASKSWLLSLNRVNIRNSRFRYIDTRNLKRDYGVDWSNVDCHNWEASLGSFSFGDTVSFSVDDFSFTEVSGFRLNKLTGRCNFAKEVIFAEDVSLEMPESHLLLSRLAFSWVANTDAWKDYCNKIDQHFKVERGSYMSFHDLSYLASTFHGIDNTLTCSGLVHNTVADLRGTSMKLAVDENIYFDCDFRILGLQDATNMILDIDISDGIFSPEELSHFYLPWAGKNIPVPEQLFAFSEIEGHDIKFEGTFRDFNVAFNSVTPGMRGNLNFYYRTDADNSTSASTSTSTSTATSSTAQASVTTSSTQTASTLASNSISSNQHGPAPTTAETPQTTPTSPQSSAQATTADNAQNNSIKFWGDFEMMDLNVGRLVSMTELGRASVKGRIVGSSDSLSTYTRVETSWPYLELGDDRLRNLSAYLISSDDDIYIYADAADEKLTAKAVMSIERDGSEAGRDAMEEGEEAFPDMSPSDAIEDDNKLNFMSLRATLHADSIARFGFSLADSIENVGVKFALISASDEKVEYDNLFISSLEYENTRGEVEVDSMLIERMRVDDRMELRVASEELSLYAEGKLENLLDADVRSKFLYRYLPSLDENGVARNGVSSSELFDKLDFRAYLLALDVEPLMEVLYPDIFVAQNTSLGLDFTERSALSFSLRSDSLAYAGVGLSLADVRMRGNVDTLNFMVRANRLAYDSLVGMRDFSDRVKIYNDRIEDHLIWGDRGFRELARETPLNGGEVSFDVAFSRARHHLNTDLNISEGLVVVEDSIWHINRAVAKLHGDTLIADGLAVEKGNSRISLDGVVSRDPSEKISLIVRNFDLDRISHFALAKNPVTMFGDFSGYCTFADYYGDKNFEVGVNLKEWGLYNDTLGNFSLSSSWDPEEKEVVIQGENRLKRNRTFSLFGTYAPSSDSLEMEVQLSTFNVETLNGYIGEYVHGTSGFISGEVNCIGTLRDPQFFGNIYLDSVEMVVNFLNTPFLINDKVSVSGSLISFDNVMVADVNGHTAIGNGYFKLWDNVYDVDLMMDDFLLLNTNSSMSDLFYGKVAASGLTHFDNLDGMNNIRLNWVTGSDSRFSLPLTSGSGNAGQILAFVESEEQKVDLLSDRKGFTSSLNLDATIELNEDLNVQVIFDPSVGDMLEASGEGTINLTIDRKGALGMSGEFRVEKGSYLFTLGGIWNKRFVLQKGGYIMWNGTPYDATLDVSAVYNLKASLYELYAAISDENERSEKSRKVSVECVLTLTDNLMNPVINLSIDFPTLDTQTKSYINSIFSSQDEVNKQVFSLLVLNKFSTPEYVASNSFGDSAGAAGVTTLAELVSTRLSKWLSRLTDAVDVGVSYRQGDEITNDEVEVALSTQLFNDRMTISANGNMDVGDSKGTTSTGSGITGDFDVDIKLNRQGTLQLKGYSHTDEKILYNSTETIQGIGISYLEQFDTFKALGKKYGAVFRRKKKKEASASK